jgi:hypothetical protein
MGGILLAAIVAALIRIFVYIIAAKPPVSIFGRMATGRLILPRYDHVFLAPIATVAAALAMVQIGVRIPMLASLWVGLTVAIVVATLLCLGPTISSWRLTSQSRLTTSEQSRDHVRTI